MVFTTLMLVATFLAAGLAIAGLVMDRLLLPSVVLAAALTGLVVAFRWFARATRQSKQLVLDSGCAICPACLYPFGDLHQDGLCPECGEPYEAARLIVLWADVYDLPRLDFRISDAADSRTAT